MTLPLALHACSAGVRQVIALVQQCQNTPTQGRGKGPRGKAKAPELDLPRCVYHPSRCIVRRRCSISYGVSRTSRGGGKAPECSPLCASQRRREPACSALFGLGKISQRELATARRSPHYRPGHGLWVRLREPVSVACRLVLLCAWSTTFDRAGTFCNYTAHLRRACLLAGASTSVFDHDALTGIKRGLKRRCQSRQRRHVTCRSPICA